MNDTPTATPTRPPRQARRPKSPKGAPTAVLALVPPADMAAAGVVPPKAARKRPPKAAAAMPAPTEPPAPHPTAVFQIHFAADQRQRLDPDLIPLDNAGHTDTVREFAVFERLAADDGVRLAPLWGAVSWKFSDKTGLSGAALLQLLAAHPGFDLYYCNPSPEAEALYANLWHQGVTAHPGFREVCECFFEAAGLEVALLDVVTPSQGFSTCNYFVGSQQFWNAYLPFVRGLIDKARAGMPAPMRKLLDSSLSDPRNLHAGASYWPFIIERLLPVFLRGPGAALRCHRFLLPQAEARLDPHLRRLREMKDVAHRTRSKWLYSCWLNYRNLYLLQTAGRDWCTRYLPQISPAEPAFW